MKKRVSEGLEKLILRHRISTPSHRVVRTLLTYSRELLSWETECAGEFLLQLESMLESFIKENRKGNLSAAVIEFLDSDEFERKMATEMNKAKENGWIFRENL